MMSQDGAIKTFPKFYLKHRRQLQTKVASLLNLGKALLACVIVFPLITFLVSIVE